MSHDELKKDQKKTVSIVVFIDAMGWEVLRGRKFMEEKLPYRRKLTSVFGFSSACVPSILTGLMPREHKHWSFFYYSPKTSPFKALKWLRFLPGKIINHGRVRGLLSKVVKKFYGYTGYFQLYNIPFKYVDLFDYCEKQDLFLPGGMNRGKNIFDHLETAGINYHVSDWRDAEENNLKAAEAAMAKGDISFALLYLPQMDALLHKVGRESDQVDGKLASYEVELGRIIDAAERQYDDVRIFVCSDHGMATVHTCIDLMKEVEALDLEFGKDYVGTYDSTMGRFWFHNDDAKEKITKLLQGIPEGRIIPHDELKELGCDFEGDQFGEMIFLVRAGVIVVPSHMGEGTITGMHGYHPNEIDSNASLLSNVPVSDEIKGIPDVFRLMCAENNIDPR